MGPDRLAVRGEEQADEAGVRFLAGGDRIHLDDEMGLLHDVAQQLGQALLGRLAVLQLAAVLAGRHRQHAVHEPAGQPIEHPRPQVLVEHP